MSGSLVSHATGYQVRSATHAAVATRPIQVKSLEGGIPTLISLEVDSSEATSSVVATFEGVTLPRRANQGAIEISHSAGHLKGINLHYGAQYLSAEADEWRQLDGRLSGDWRLQRALSIHVWSEAGEYVAESPLLGVHAFGATQEAALSYLRRRLVDLRQRLNPDDPQLSSHMRSLARSLADVVISARA